MHESDSADRKREEAFRLFAAPAAPASHHNGSSSSSSIDEEMLTQKKAKLNNLHELESVVRSSRANTPVSINLTSNYPQKPRDSVSIRSVSEDIALDGLSAQRRTEKRKL